MYNPSRDQLLADAMMAPARRDKGEKPKEKRRSAALWRVFWIKKKCVLTAPSWTVLFLCVACVVSLRCRFLVRALAVPGDLPIFPKLASTRINIVLIEMDFMEKRILNHYRQYSTYTDPGCYENFFRSLPDDIPELGRLVCSQVIHRVALKNGNTGANADKKYGDMKKYPWNRLRCEDDVLMTTTAMVAELLRLDASGFKIERAVEHKIVVTCRYVSVLMASILKSKGIPARCRSGFAPYCLPGISGDHWINQYWSGENNRWINCDADGFFENLEFDQFDIPNDKFFWAANVWLDIRHGKTDGTQFVYADDKGTKGLKAAIRAIFYDFHALMNNEISYEFQPSYIDRKFETLKANDFEEIDELATLLLNPDVNFDKIMHLWETRRKYRILNSPLVGDLDHTSLELQDL